MAIGNIYSIQIDLIGPTTCTDRGLVKILSFDGESWFGAALDDFVSEKSAHDLASEILTVRKVKEFPGRDGPIFARGKKVPETWEFIANAELNMEEAHYAELYDRWKDPTASMFDSQTAYAEFGGAQERLESLDDGLAIEWRFRFDLDAVLEEDAERKRRIAEYEEQKPTWEKISNETFSSGTPDLQKFVQPFLNKLIGDLSAKRNKTIAKKALTEFFKNAYQHPIAGEYRDEIASVGADFGIVCGLRPDQVYKIAEKAM